MRPDFAQVIIERGRVGGWGKHNRLTPRRPSDWDAYHPYEGMTLPYGYDGKTQTDMFSIMERWMHAQIGRQWDDVYSEIVKTCGRGLLGQHAKGHLVKDIVQRHVRMIHGVPHELASYAPSGWQRLDPGDLYVHPETGIITKVPGQPTSYHGWKPTPPKGRPIPGSTDQLHFIHGAWFRVCLESRVYRFPGFKDVVGVEWKDAKAWYGKTELFAYAKRQLSKKEKKQFKL